MIVLTSLKMFTYNAQTDRTTSIVQLQVFYTTPYSIAARNMEAPVSFLADTTHYTMDRLTGQVTEMPLSGVNTAATRFMSYEADGLLYVLDYGNRQIDSFDPDAAFASIRSFTLETGVITANQ